MQRLDRTLDQRHFRAFHPSTSAGPRLHPAPEQHRAVAQAQVYPRPAKASGHLDLAGSRIGIRVQKGQLANAAWLHDVIARYDLTPQPGTR